MPERYDLERERIRRLARGALFKAEVTALRVGRYEIEERIGHGGMSTVYRAFDPQLKRRVAIKVVSPSIAKSNREEYEKRLVREGTALANLAHPNVVTVFDVGHADFGPFLAIELVEGVPLSTWVTQEEQSLDAILDVMLAAAEGLAAAHAAGVVHRDITPRNIVIDPRGIVRIIDFGLVQTPSADEVMPAQGSNITATGVLGTPPYIAPEIWSREKVDNRADQFGFCATFFEALCGHRPFAGDLLFEVRDAITSGRLSQRAQSNVPEWLAECIRKGLALNAAERYASMSAFITEVSKRRSSVRQTQEAREQFTVLKELLPQPKEHDAAIAQRSIALRATLARAQSDWAENQVLHTLRRDVLLALTACELKRGNANAAKRTLAEIPEPPPDLAEAVASLVASDEKKESRLRKLAEIERQADVNLRRDGKLRMLVTNALFQGLTFFVFAYLHARGHFEVTTLHVGLVFSVWTVLHVGAEFTHRELMFVNESTRRTSQHGLVATIGHAALFLVAHALSLSLAEAFIMGFVQSTVVWSISAVVIDRRTWILPPVTGACALATGLWPTLSLMFYGISAIVGIGGYGLLMLREQVDPEGIANPL